MAIDIHKGNFCMQKRLKMIYFKLVSNYIAVQISTMKKLMSIQYSSFAFNASTLIMRLVFGGMMIRHGFNKLTKFNEIAPTFIDPFHIGTKASLGLVVFAEFFCALFLLIGLFTRGALIALIICMAVAVFVYHKGQSLDESESAIIYLGAYIALLLTGPGKFSVDGMVK